MRKASKLKGWGLFCLGGRCAYYCHPPGGQKPVRKKQRKQGDESEGWDKNPLSSSLCSIWRIAQGGAVMNSPKTFFSVVLSQIAPVSKSS